MREYIIGVKMRRELMKSVDDLGQQQVAAKILVQTINEAWSLSCKQYQFQWQHQTNDDHTQPEKFNTATSTSAQ